MYMSLVYLVVCKPLRVASTVVCTVCTEHRTVRVVTGAVVAWRSEPERESPPLCVYVTAQPAWGFAVAVVVVAIASVIPLLCLSYHSTSIIMSTPPKISSPVNPDGSASPTTAAPPTIGLTSPTSPPGYTAPPGPLPPTSSAAPPSTTTTTAAPVLHSNPKVAELQTMFPTVDVAVIELVLETCGGSTDRSIEQLLTMTDENFKPDELESVRREEAVSSTPLLMGKVLKLTMSQSQVDLDEEFARSLVMQDEQHRQDRGTIFGQRGGGGGDGGRGTGGGNVATPIGNLPYEPRVRSNRPANQNSGGQWEQPAARNEQRTHREGENPPGMLAVEAKVNQFAEGTFTYPPPSV